MSAVNKVSLQDLGTFLDAENSKKEVSSYPSSLIQERVSILKGIRNGGLLPAGCGLTVAVFVTILAVSIYFASHPATMSASDRAFLPIILGSAWGVGGSFMLVGIAISSVCHWKLKRKLSKEEIETFIKEEKAEASSYLKRLAKDRFRLDKQEEKARVHQGQIEALGNKFLSSQSI